MRGAGIELDDVTKRYDTEVVAVRELSLLVEPGEIFALFGPSGCGKTTTLRLIAGFERPDEGTVRIGERVVDDGERHVPAEKRRIGFVFQDYALFPHLSVAGNVAFGLSLSAAERRHRVDEVLEVCALDGFRDRFPHELSGGQQQRVAVARALAPDYPIVLLDEPLSNLDVTLRASLRAELAQILRASAKTVLLVTHDRDEAFEMCDRAGVMLAGRLHQVGAPEELHRRPATRDVAELLGDASFLPGRIENGAVRTELGLLKAETEGEEGAAVDVLVRDNALELEPHEGGEAEVVWRAFRGTYYLLRIRLPSGAELRCRHEDPRLEVGRRLRARWRADESRHPCVFGAESG